MPGKRRVGRGHAADSNAVGPLHAADGNVVLTMKKWILVLILLFGCASVGYGRIHSTKRRMHRLVAIEDLSRMELVRAREGYEKLTLLMQQVVDFFREVEEHEAIRNDLDRSEEEFLSEFKRDWEAACLDLGWRDLNCRIY
jgi:hypothetical protein